MTQVSFEAQERFVQAAFQVLKAAQETMLNTALTTAGLISYLQEQMQGQWKELFTQSEEVRKAQLARLESFVKEARELNSAFHQHLQELAKSSLQVAASANPYWAAWRQEKQA